jgi:hypothetical protein
VGIERLARLIATFVRRFNEIGDMMRKILVSSTVTAALCSLAISVAPALGLEFESEGTFSSTSSTEKTTVQLGTSGWLECEKMSMKTVMLTVGALTDIELELEKYTTCHYHNKLETESVSDAAGVRL